jgi:hypothetical protein
MTASLVSAQSAMIEDRFGTIVGEVLPTTFPLLEFADRTTQGVNMLSSDGNSADFGRLFGVKHTWTQGSAGLLRPTNPLGTAVLDGPNSLKLTDSNDSELAPIPSAALSPHTGVFTRTLYLHAGVGNLGIPLHWLLTDAMDAAKIKQLVNDLKACAEMTRRQDAISFSSYRATGGTANSAGGYNQVTVLGRIVTASKATHALSSASSASSNANFVDLVIDPTYGQIQNFWPGMEVDIVANSGGSASAAGTLQNGAATDASDVRNYNSTAAHVQVFVTHVNRVTNTVTVLGVMRTTTDAIVTYADATGWQGTTGISAYDWICPRNASTYTAAERPWFTYGLNDWMKKSGYIMGGAAYSEGLDVNEYPMFQSLVCSNLAGPLTEQVFNADLAQGHAIFPHINLNSVICTPGALMKFIENRQANATESWQRANMPFEVKGGWTLSDYVTPHGTFKWWTSPFCLKGDVYINQIDKANLKLYTNKIIGSEQTGFAEGVRFLGPSLGYPSIRVPEMATNGTPKFIVGTPWIRFALLCPIMPNGIKYSGVTETDLSSRFV